MCKISVIFITYIFIGLDVFKLVKIFFNAKVKFLHHLKYFKTLFLQA